jgi:hypothetical protein
MTYLVICRTAKNVGGLDNLVKILLYNVYYFILARHLG